MYFLLPFSFPWKRKIFYAKKTLLITLLLFPFCSLSFPTIIWKKRQITFLSSEFLRHWNYSKGSLSLIPNRKKEQQQQQKNGIKIFQVTLSYLTAFLPCCRREIMQICPIRFSFSFIQTIFLVSKHLFGIFKAFPNFCLKLFKYSVVFLQNFSWKWYKL